MKEKQKVRSSSLANLKVLTIEERGIQEAYLQEKFFDHVTDEIKSVGLFLNFPFEFHTESLIEELKKQGKDIYVPRVEDNAIVFLAYDETTLELSKFGLMEPSLDSKSTKPDLLLVPALAYNEAGFRVGFGGGYYDRYLEDFSGISIGLAYDFQRKEFPVEKFDQPVNYVYFYEEKK